MFNWYYIIKKTGLWKNPIPMYWWIFLPIAYILMPIIMFFPIYLDYIQGGDMDKEEFVWMLIFLWLFGIYWIYLLIEAIKQKRVKNFKYNWWWVLKKAKVKSIEKTKASRGKWSRIDVYYLEAEDWGEIYYSYGYTKWAVLWTSITDLQLLYDKYWYGFDENQTQKEALLKKIDEMIAEKEYEIENSWFISKIIKNKKLWKLKSDKATVSIGYVPPYWQIDEKKVTVWDIVDVYVDPNNPEKYRVDTDFLFW